MSLALPASEGARSTETGAVEPALSTIRVPELDGLRGLMTLFVVASHFFGEVPGGITVLCVGWVAVNVFFVLSGYLVGRLIIEKKDAGNFLAVFYLRRVCRTFPAYFLCCALILAATAALAGFAWAQASEPLPPWSYFLFLQNCLFLRGHSVGVHWLAPTWTLALEEQFYLFAPFVFLLVPRRFWVAVLLACALLGFAGRAYGVAHGLLFAPLLILPTSADVLCAGLLLAVLVGNDSIPWQRWRLAFRMAPVILLFATFAVLRLDREPGGPWFQVFGTPLMSIASALFILMLVKGAPEAKRFRSPALRFFGTISYSTYLVHLAVLGLLHGAVLGAAPSLDSAAALAVTLAALPPTILIAWVLTITIEHPITEWGRSFRWRGPRAA